MSRAAQRLVANGWTWVSEKWRGCIHEVYWRDPTSGDVLQQRTAVIRMKRAKARMEALGAVVFGRVS